MNHFLFIASWVGLVWLFIDIGLTYIYNEDVKNKIQRRRTKLCGFSFPWFLFSIIYLIYHFTL